MRTKAPGVSSGARSPLGERPSEALGIDIVTRMGAMAA